MGKQVVRAGGAAKPRRRHDGWDGIKKNIFLEILARVGNVRDACRGIAMSSTSAYRMRRRDPAFGELWDASLRRAATNLETVAYQRAVEGVEEVVIRDGKEAWRKRRYSDSMLRLLLQGSNPEKYGRTGAQATVKAREDIEKRVRQIEQRAYIAAWKALIAEYVYQAEPEYMRMHLLHKIAVMHEQMCSNALCEQCHPERAREGSPGDHAPPKNHQPIDAPGMWVEERRRGWTEEKLRCAAEGRTHRIPSPEAWRPRRNYIPPQPPYWPGSAAEDSEAEEGEETGL